MIDYALLLIRLLFVALLYLFLFAIMKTGIGAVRGQRNGERGWSPHGVARAPQARPASRRSHPVWPPSRHDDGDRAQGESLPSRIAIVGRNPGADIVIGAGYVSGRHARFSLMGQNLFVEDLGSTNGTAVNGQFINEPTALRNGDTVNVGDVAIRVRFA